MNTGQGPAEAPQGRQTAYKISDCALMDNQHLFYDLGSHDVISSTAAVCVSSPPGDSSTVIVENPVDNRGHRGFKCSITQNY